MPINIRPVERSTLKTIGNTPVVRLKHVVPENSADVLVKLEFFNPTGSYKDRMALAMIEEAEKRGDLRPGMTVVEYTGGSTGSSIAFICAVKGYRFKVVSSDAFAREKLDTMHTIEEADAKEIARRLAREEGIFSGTSTGLNVAGALHQARELGPGHTVATVAVDTGLKYLAGDLYREQ